VSIDNVGSMHEGGSESQTDMCVCTCGASACEHASLKDNSSFKLIDTSLYARHVLALIERGVNAIERGVNAPRHVLHVRHILHVHMLMYRLSAWVARRAQKRDRDRGE